MWYKTYSHTIAIALDCLAAAVFFNRTDTTVSSLCAIVLGADTGEGEWAWKLRSLKLSAWQVHVLRAIGRLLEDIQKGHCAGAVASDVARAKSTQQLLS